MAITLSTGVTVSVGKTFSPAIGVAALTVTQITNANPAVATVTNTFAAGDYVVLTSGWGLLDGKCVRLSAANGTTITLEGVDTSDTNKYPGGATAGAGGVRKVVTWSQITQIKSMSASGGSQNFADITSIADTVQRQVPTTRAAVSMTMDIYDDPNLAWYADVTVADNARSPYPLLMTFPNNSKLAANAYWSLMRIPTMASNEALVTQISLSYSAEPIRYST